MYIHKVCKECVQNGSCLFQDHGDVEFCEDVEDAIYGKFIEEEEDEDEGI